MIVDVLFVLAIVGILIAIYKTKFAQKKTPQQIKAEVLRETSAKQKQHQEQLKPQPSTTTEWTGENDSSEQQSQNQQSDSRSPTNTRLSLYKQQKRKQKQQRKQAQQHMLEESKQKRQQYERLQEQKQREEEEKRRKQEEYIEQMREEERKRKEQEFNKWKDMFQVEESGVSKESEDVLKKKQLELENNLLHYLKTRKLTLLEDASHKFTLPTKELVDKIKKLQAEQKISGVFDQRGKYLYMEQREWDAVKNYITAKGRLKKSEMMNECAKIIKIPENHDDQLINLVNAQIQQQQKA